MCSNWLSVGVINTMTQSNWTRKRLISSYLPQPIVQQSHDRNGGETLLTGLFFSGLTRLPFSNARAHLFRDSSTHSVQVGSVSNQENTPQANLKDAVSPPRCPLPRCVWVSVVDRKCIYISYSTDRPLYATYVLVSCPQRLLI